MDETQITSRYGASVREFPNRGKFSVSRRGFNYIKASFHVTLSSQQDYLGCEPIKKRKSGYSVQHDPLFSR